MKLTDLEPKMKDFRANERGYQHFSFLCPACRKLRLLHAIWSRASAEVKWTDTGGKECSERVWHATQGPLRDWDTLSLTPSIDMPPHKLRDGQCPGWHGFITDGEVL